MLPLILAGVVISAFFTAAHGLIQTIADPENKLPAMVYWLIGSFAGANPHKVAILAPPVLLAGGALLLLRWRINLLSLDDLDAAALGQRSAGAALDRRRPRGADRRRAGGGQRRRGLGRADRAAFRADVVGPDHRRLLPASALTGAIFLLLTDDIGRTLAPQELPIGILTAGLGTPVFALLFWRRAADEGNGAMNEHPPSVLPGLGHAYHPRRWVFRHYAARLERGRVLALLGPNGRGKTTLLRLLLGAMKPTEGVLQVDGRAAFAPQLFQAAFDYSVLDMVLDGPGPAYPAAVATLAPRRGGGPRSAGPFRPRRSEPAPFPATFRRPKTIGDHRPRAGLRAPIFSSSTSRLRRSI